MNNEQIKKIIDEPYDDSIEVSYMSMARDFYNRKMLTTIIFCWTWGIIIIAGAVYSGIKFFEVDQSKFQIMYAAIFLCCAQLLVLIKIFAWQFIHSNGIKREIKRLELRIAELTEVVKSQ